ncbi:hypothetical protein ELI20_01150 [Rhizobium ruizarguesonis]|jgi:hypothetical protein|uniref:hypothetical protein n=1 Tax=Rhizobium ruizarguesonis TaxID=2081791 RepID=UPI00102FF869|nr:hypothetical protein [Rhizobium ruizarguesonis]TAW19924.1 hypothetical protein ELI20_01150 [Rhizobium ruizarguesonis]
MPEMNQSKKLARWSLADARAVGHILVVQCQYCRITRRYLPDDILKFQKNTSVDRVRFRCQECGKRDYIHVSVYSPSSSDIGKLPVRRLVGMRDVKMPIWRDETM